MIEEAESWMFFKDIDFNDPDINQFNVDTRDFCVGYTVESSIDKLNLVTINKYPHFFYTGDEVKDVLQRLFDESGGDAEWRYLSLTGDAEKASENWELKYLRIIRTPLGWVICSNSYRALSKSVLECSVNQKLLCAH